MNEHHNKSAVPAPVTVKSKFGGIALIVLGIMSAVMGADNGYYDITAAMFFVPVGFVMIFGNNE